MNRYYQHFKTVMQHKKVVRQMCFKFGLYKRGLLHDLSKFSITEFAPSARYFQGTSSPIDKEKQEKATQLLGFIIKHIINIINGIGWIGTLIKTQLLVKFQENMYMK